ncbi:MAG TPA: 1-acyl-sn-glycerol-3-phosphate acyltransferase, partial [Candidatus Brachybacterium intestinipullorum]|nr:1-acyl-sn-glycerol-3-phosphate acyltransferase [Candidatus Brachybacterium intestinipullorum]
MSTEDSEKEPEETRPESERPEEQEPTRRAEAAARFTEASSRAADATAKAADDLKDRSRRLFDSLSARSRGEGWEKPTGELAKYRSRWRAG